MENLTVDELLEIVVALDNEATNSKAENYCKERFNMLLDIKRKVFAIMEKVEREEMTKEAADGLR